MEVLRAPEVEGLGVLKHRKVGACGSLYKDSNGFDADDTSDETKSLQKGIGKCSSVPSLVSIAPLEVDEVAGMQFRRIVSADSLESRHLFSIALPSHLDLVSALKGSRQKRGITLKKQNVTWASDVYDPPPTSLMRMISIRKQQKLMKSNNVIDRRKSGRAQQKVLKVNKYSHVIAGGKDMKKVRKNNGSSYRWCKQLMAELCEECCFFDSKSSSNVHPLGG